jgi:GNAT superfamily N-acetyltransferase
MTRSFKKKQDPRKRSNFATNFHETHVSAERLTINWCGNAGRSRELAAFFAQHVDPSYISHSELQGSRALSPDRWCNDLPDTLNAEIEPRLQQTGSAAPARTSQPILVAEKDGDLVGLSFVTFAGAASVPFAVVEDVVVIPAMRSHGIGKSILDWIAGEARTRNIRRLFLESGVRNERAHRFFEQDGFHVVSVVMMRSL